MTKMSVLDDNDDDNNSNDLKKQPLSKTILSGVWLLLLEENPGRHRALCNRDGANDHQ